MSPTQIHRPERKMFGKREENGVSTQHVLRMRPYTHTKTKDAQNVLL